MSEATHAGYAEDSVPKYEILATLDSKTCSICGDLDNEVYEVGKEVVGVNMPPFHPLCRCTTVPHYDDTPTEGLTRVARDPETGKTYEVPADMSYREWKKKFIEKTSKFDTIEPENTKEDIRVHSVGKIDRDIYKCITDDIVTDEVIITDNQIQHILDRHPDAYETAMKEMRTAIESPDYIIADDKHDNTGLVIKKFKMKGDNLQLVLRVCTHKDEPGYKNSVISCWEISEKRLENYLKNKRVLYKKE